MASSMGIEILEKLVNQGIFDNVCIVCKICLLSLIRLLAASEKLVPEVWPHMKLFQWHFKNIVGFYSCCTRFFAGWTPKHFI